MNATPRVRSGGFPQTPGTVAPRARRDSTPSSQPRQQRPRPSLPPAPENRSAAAVAERPPLIPLTVIDAPTQRFYAVALYVALLAYRFWDWIYVVEEDAGSFMLFGKWVALDFAFLFVALPALRIPWLDLSQPVAITLFFAQSVLNWVLMFNIQVYWTTWLLGVVKIFYDRELSISEHNVKVSSILHNSSLIMGKQIINILPEGSALLNPEKTPFCVGPGGKNVVAVPLYFNATIPAEVELVRIDLETNNEEVVKLSKSQIREIDRQAKKMAEDGGITSYRYDVPVKKVGAYRLHKVLDEYKLEVQRITEPTYVVPCPKALVRRAESSTRCLNDLSNLSLEVHGTPPLKIVYSRTINGKDHSFHFQSLQPDGFSSPLLGAAKTSAIVLTEGEDVTWARAQQVAVALNESMSHAGEWQYAIDEVHDVFGNVVKYTVPGDDGEVKPKPKHLVQNFVVRKRPQATLRDCDLRNPLKVARGLSTQLPVRFSLPGQAANQASYTLTWQFSPIDTLTKSGDHGDVVEIGTFTAKSARDQPTISAPGLYTLKSISCDSCDGEIEEPSSCLLLNPLEPKLAITAEGIPDKCASTSIGLRVDLDLVGTPPFKVVYDVTSDTERHRTESVVVKGLRQQIDLLPRSAGHYQYRFRSIQDAVYHSVNLPLTDEYTLEQNVKPPATAYFENQSGLSACLDQQVEVDVTLLGDGPFTLEWELVHDGTRDTKTIKNIETNSYKIQTAPLTKGGEYTIALKSIRDKTGCSIFLKEEKHISVRRQRPRAGFGQIEKKRSATVVEEARVNLPLRLHGEGPWQVSYRNLDSGRGVQVKKATSPNDFIETTEHGTFEIVDVMDNQCHGQVDPSATKFDVAWFPRPEISVVPADTISENRGVFVKQEVCEGDIDGFEVALKGKHMLFDIYCDHTLTCAPGTAPYHVAYEIRHKPKSGSGSVARKEFDAAMPKASIPLDTGKAGLYTYKFSALADNLYNNDKRKFQPLTVEQRVNAKPSACFVKPGQILKMCMSEQEYEEKIPITLQGVAPFYVEIEIRHNSGSIPETFRIPNIPSSSYNIQIPRQYLKLGAQTIRIRNVRDARGCQQKIEVGGPSVQVQLYDAPSIYPLETRSDYCVGERIAYTLSGLPPFEVQYTFAGSQMKAKSQSTNFRRIAEAPGDFTITSVSDKASECRAALELTKTIHPMPSVRISRGKVVRVDIHEGSEVEILFEFWGTPPFEFTYTRSSNANPRKGQRSVVLETRHDVSYEHSKIVTASLEGTYEVVAIKDKYCAFSTMAGASGADGGKKDKAQKMLAY
jgi:nucleoporin POM152